MGPLSPLLGVHGRGSAATQGYFVSELVTVCKQLNTKTVSSFRREMRRIPILGI